MLPGGCMKAAWKEERRVCRDSLQSEIFHRRFHQARRDLNQSVLGHWPAGILSQHELTGYRMRAPLPTSDSLVCQASQERQECL